MSICQARSSVIQKQWPVSLLQYAKAIFIQSIQYTSKLCGVVITPDNFQSRLWVSTKLEEDPKYESQLSAPFKEAIKFATFFKKERMSNSCTLAEVAKMVGMTRANLYAFELLHLRERTLLKRYRTLSNWMSQTPNFQALKEKNEGLGNGRVKIDSLLTKEEVEFVDKLVKTRTRLGMNQTQLANVLGTSTGTISSFEQFNLGLKNWREWLLRLDQWVQDHQEKHEERELDKELPEWSIFLEQEQLDSQKVLNLENHFKNNIPPRGLSDHEILLIAEEIDLEFKKVKLWFSHKFQVWSLFQLF